MAGFRFVMGLALIGALGACVPRSAPPPAPPAPPPIAPPPRPTLPPPPPPVLAWDEAPATPGDWTRALTGAAATAWFGQPGAAVMTVRCTAPGRIALTYNRAAAADRLAVRTSFGARALPAVQGTATLPASDPLFDQMAFSRGRFALEAPGAAMVIVPAWPELAWVVEHCRS